MRSQNFSGVACSSALICRTYGITVFMDGWNKELVELVEMVKKGLKKLKREVQEKGLKLSITEGGTEGTKKRIRQSLLASIWRKILKNEAGKELLWRRVLKRWA